MKVKLEFSGGLDTLFGGVKEQEIDFDKETMEELIEHIRANLLKEREELFVSGNTVRPGIIVMINDTDWELEDTLAYKV